MNKVIFIDKGFKIVDSILKFLDGCEYKCMFYEHENAFSYTGDHYRYSLDIDNWEVCISRGVVKDYDLETNTVESEFDESSVAFRRIDADGEIEIIGVTSFDEFENFILKTVRKIDLL